MSSTLVIDVAKKPSGRPKGAVKSISVQLRIPEDIVEAIEKMAAHNERQRTQECMIAIKERLKAQGFWPASREGE